MTRDEVVRDNGYWLKVAVMLLAFVAVLAIVPQVVGSAVAGVAVLVYIVIIGGALGVAASVVLLGLMKGVTWFGHRVVLCVQGNCCFGLRCA